MDMGLAQILKAEYGDVEVEEEAAGLPEFTIPGRTRRLHRQARNRNARSRQKFEFEKAARLRDSIKELRDKISLRRFLVGTS
jgi:excinuclease ABC subunit B